MKPNMIYAGVCGLLLSGVATSAVNASLVATFSVGADTTTLTGAPDGSGQNLQIQSSMLSGLGGMNIYGFSASSNSPSAPANGQVPIEKAAATVVAANAGSTFQTLTINLSDNGFSANSPGASALLTGAASVTFFAVASGSQTLDYFQYASSANSVSVASSILTFNPALAGNVATENVAVGPVEFAFSNPYTLGSTLTLGLNPGDSATLTFQTDPTPAALPLPGTSALLALGLSGLSGLALLRRKRFV
jgi:hypothetical protein